ncbi:MAG: ABC transporter ATP-binding protein [Fibrobacteria bacterium]|nr:ABC transporter ATP-binding protein [Fibrobacteria bacterium]
MILPSPADRPLVKVEDLHHDHAGEQALRGISLSVPPGSLYGLVGADGAGKSTLFQILATLLPPRKGSVEVLGVDVSKGRPEIRSRIGYMPQRFSLYGDLSVRENLQFASDIVGLRGTAARSVFDELVSFSRLESAVERPARNLSGGMKQKLALCCALVRKPPLLLLDEPTVGVDPVTRVDFWDMLGRLRDSGTTILVSTPYMDEAERCQHVALVHKGRILAQGSPAALGSTLPGRLWRLHGPKALAVRVDACVPPPLLDLYPSGGDLRALAPRETSPEAVLQAVETGGLEISEIHSVEPTVEDVLLHALAHMEEPA